MTTLKQTEDYLCDYTRFVFASSPDREGLSSATINKVFRDALQRKTAWLILCEDTQPVLAQFKRLCAGLNLDSGSGSVFSKSGEWRVEVRKAGHYEGPNVIRGITANLCFLWVDPFADRIWEAAVPALRGKHKAWVVSDSIPCGLHDMWSIHGQVNTASFAHART
jgi:hypothetical protein